MIRNRSSSWACFNIRRRKRTDMNNLAIIDRVLETINLIEDARRETSAIESDVRLDGENVEVSELLESSVNQLAGAVEALDTVVQLLDLE